MWIYTNSNDKKNHYYGITIDGEPIETYDYMSEPVRLIGICHKTQLEWEDLFISQIIINVLQ
jgi:hypothetical protein